LRYNRRHAPSLFLGTPDFATPTLAELIGEGHSGLVYTRAPPEGSRAAEEKSLTNCRSGGIEGARHVPSRMGTNGGSLPRSLMLLWSPRAHLPSDSEARARPTNLHASLLPRWRGAAPIRRAIIAGDRETVRW
jgi:methionyl-tRNA formyltransferase